MGLEFLPLPPELFSLWLVEYYGHEVMVFSSVTFGALSSIPFHGHGWNSELQRSILQILPLVTMPSFLSSRTGLIALVLFVLMTPLFTNLQTPWDCVITHSSFPRSLVQWLDGQ